MQECPVLEEQGHWLSCKAVSVEQDGSEMGSENTRECQLSDFFSEGDGEPLKGYGQKNNSKRFGYESTVKAIYGGYGVGQQKRKQER